MPIGLIGSTSSTVMVDEPANQSKNGRSPVPSRREQCGIPNPQNDTFGSGRSQALDSFIKPRAKALCSFVRIRRPLIVLRDQLEDVEELLAFPLQKLIQAGSFTDPDNHLLTPEALIDQVS